MASRGQGEHAGLSRELVLDAAVALVDSGGLDGLSMRKLGAALGVEAMTVYHYVPSKAALLEGLVEWVLRHSATNPGATDGLSWDQVLRRYAETLRATLLSHPGVLPLFFGHPAVTPQGLRTAENGLRVLTDAGFGLRRALDMLNVLSIFVVGHTMAEVANAELGQRADLGPAAASAQLGAGDLPLVIEAARLGRGPGDRNRFQFGLDALLAGFAR